MKLATNHWYPVLEPREVGRRPLGVERLGLRLVFWRDSSGQLHAQDERCLHMGAALSHGTINGEKIVCPFHGFEFDAAGHCAHAPALDKAIVAPVSLAVRTCPVLERHDLVWLWWGSDPPGDRVPAFFKEMETSWTHRTIAVDWPVHYTRAIENQLDVVHLPFIHRNTIGRANRTLVDGPVVEWKGDKMRYTYVFNRGDDGTRPSSQVNSRPKALPASPVFPGCPLKRGL